MLIQHIEETSFHLVKILSKADTLLIITIFNVHPVGTLFAWNFHKEIESQM